MTVTVAIVAYNEEKYISNLLDDLLNQDYDKSKMEILLIDGCSTDETKRIMLEFANKNRSNYFNVDVLDNQERIQAAGWNIAIEKFSTEMLIRVDAHVTLPSNFVSLNVETMKGGENICGGVRPCVIENKTQWGEILLRVENSLFGSSINKSRHSTQKSYVKTLFHGAYRKEVFEKVGGFNKKLARTEDNELHYRMREAGYKFCYNPSIKSYQYARSSLKKMVKQKYGNGYWIGLTMGVCPKCFSLYHFVPLGFFLAILASSVLACFGLWQFIAALGSLYLLFCVANTIISSIGEKFNPFCFLMPILFFVLHFSYGLGTFLGLLLMPIKRKRLKREEK